MINGKEPSVGATVYDIQKGTGKIIQVEPDLSFVVDFGGGSNLRFSSGGYVGNSRRVYWNNPVVVEPSANDETWATFVTISKAIYQLLQTIRRK